MANPLRSVLRGLEGSLLTHRNARFEAAPATLAGQLSGAQINKRDQVSIWREDFGQAHRAVTHPGVLTVSDVGLIGHTRQNDAEHKAPQAIVNIVASSGRPLFFPFKKRWDIASSFKHLDLLFAAPKQGPRERVALLGSSHIGFYHFVTDVVGDWWFLQQMGYRERDFSMVVVHGQRAAWQEEVLDMLRIPREKRRYHFEVKERHVDLVLPYRTKGLAVVVPTWMCDALRSELGAGLGDRAGTRKIYLSRKDASRRRMLDEADIIERLKKIGFEVLQLEGMTISEQQELFGSAQAVVAGHGAGLTNIVWCPTNATIVDIQPTVPPTPCFKILAELRGLRYVPIFVPQHEALGRDDWRIGAEAIDCVLDSVRGL